MRRILPVCATLLAIWTAPPAAVAPVTTINGSVPPGSVTPLDDVSVMLDTVQADGNELLVLQGTRRPGTRVAIHVHDYGGHTCVLSGTITDFMDGHEPMTYPAGTCYYMPPDTPMSAANLGTEQARLIDTFVFPPGAEPTTMLEPGS
ncbi:cupin domain-containing protein [Mycolicibacterium sp. CH28]|uniref:cupin domain-containing protein n=1 Tax=Mycolicibacterium sp. CH28 TaxID=2512237 RepID=UPI0010817654|nr:cupin domain-containing protein [Mycolicibacterium sp. CH28]TGD88004.1 cupin domain-containing protein [Mycolicibacterium sp. CH28]